MFIFLSNNCLRIWQPRTLAFLSAEIIERAANMNLRNAGLASFMQVFLGNHVLLSGGVHTPFPLKQSLEAKHPSMVWGWFMTGFTRLLRRTPHHLPPWSYNFNHFLSPPVPHLCWPFAARHFFTPKKIVKQR